MNKSKLVIIIGLIFVVIAAFLFVMRHGKEVTATSRVFLACDSEGAREGLERWRSRFSSSEFDLAAGKVYAKCFKSGDAGGTESHQLPSNYVWEVCAAKANHLTLTVTGLSRISMKKRYQNIKLKKRARFLKRLGICQSFIRWTMI